MEDKAIISVNAIGLDDRSLKTLSFFFKKFCNDSCEISSEHEAEVFLINMDSVDAGEQLERIKRRYPKSPLILTSIKLIDNKEHYFLRKPMVAKHLLVILSDIRDSSASSDIVEVDNDVQSPAEDTSAGHAAQLLNEQEITAFVGNAEDIDLYKPNELSKVFFEPQHYFLGSLHQAYQLAKKESSVVKITGLWRPIIIFPNENQIYIDLSDRQLQSICVVSLQSEQSRIDNTIKIDKIDSQTAREECAKKDKFQNLESFIWKMALWTSRGRLPKGISLDSPVYLSAWPNMTRLIVTPYALRIAAYWISHPRTLMNLTKHLAIPQRYIFSFFTATYMTSLSGSANRASDSLILPTKIQPTSKQNFFSRIMNKLYSKEL